MSTVAEALFATYLLVRASLWLIERRIKGRRW